MVNEKDISICRAQDGAIFEVLSHSQESVADLKLKIEKVTNIPNENQYLLLFGGTTLSPSRLLSDYNLPSNETIFVLDRTLLGLTANLPTEQLFSPPEYNEPEISPLEQSDSEDPKILKIKRQQHTAKHNLEKVDKFRIIAASRHSICKDYAKKIEFQENCMRAASNLLQSHFQQIFRSWHDLYNRYSTMQGRHQKELSEFPAAIEKLQQIQVHEALRDSEKKTLYDLIDSERVQNWAKDCSTRFASLKTQMNECNDEIKSFQEKVRSYIDIEVVSKPSFLLNEGAQYVEKLLHLKIQFSTELKKMTDLDLSRGFSWDLCDKFEEILNKQKKEIENLKSFDEKLLAILSEMSQLKVKSSEILHKHLQEVTSLQSKLEEIMTNKVSLCREEMAAEKKRFSQFGVIKKMPETYEACLKEISRRRAFQRKILSFLDNVNETLQELRTNECKKRKSFLQNGPIPRSLPDLDKNPPILVVSLSDNINEELPDVNVPTIENETPPVIRFERRVENPSARQTERYTQERYEERIQELEKQLDQVFFELEEKDRQIQEFDTIYETLEKRLEESRKGDILRAKELEEYSKQLEESKVQSNTLKEKEESIHNMELTISSLSAEIEGLKEQLKTREEEKKKSIEEIKNENQKEQKKLEERIANLQSEYEETKKKQEDFKSRFEILSDELAKLNESYSKSQEEIETLKKEKDKLQEDHLAVNTSNAQSRERMKELEEGNRRQREELDGKGAENVALKEEISSLQDKIATLKRDSSKFSEQQSLINELVSSIDHLKRENTKLYRQLSGTKDLEQSLNSRSKRIENLEKKLAEAEKALDSKQAKLIYLEEQKTNLEKQMEDIFGMKAFSMLKVSDFKLGDFVLFILNKNGFYEAYNEDFPNCFINNTIVNEVFAEEKKQEKPILGEIVHIDKGINNDKMYGLKKGTEYYEVYVAKHDAKGNIASMF